MQRSFLIFPFLFCLALTACTPYIPGAVTRPCAEAAPAVPTDPRYARLAAILQEYSKKGLPGISLAVYTPAGGWWAGAAGFADIEERVPMQTCHLHYLQSVSKTYLAVAVLQLKEKGRIILDSPMTAYLPAIDARYIPNAKAITVRMLMNHTSGVAEYADEPAYVTYLLQHPARPFATAEFLAIAKKRGPKFPPGSRFEYTNTNYELLALIVDVITGDHATYIREHIFTPLGLNATAYRNDSGYLHRPDLVNSYLDRYGDGLIENVSLMQQVNVGSMIGDDGIVAAPQDVIKFMKSLMENKLLTPASLDEMQGWVRDRKGHPRYGLGLYHLSLNGQTAIGHGGSGIGAGCELYYLPAQHSYLFMAVNLGVLIEGPLTTVSRQCKDAIVRVLQQE